MNHSALIREVHCFGDGCDDCRRFSGCQRSVLQQTGEALTIDVTHRKIMLPIVLTNFEDWHNAGMIETRGRLGFALKAKDVFLASQLAGQNHLERYDSIQFDLAGLVDDTHSASRNLLEQLIVAKILTALGGR